MVHLTGTFGPTTPPDYHTLTNVLTDPDNQKRDRNVPATIIRHGNFDYVNNAVVWDPNIPDHTIPNSLYLSGRPSWWGNLPWPPIGPDLNPMVGLIPAQVRYQGIVGGTPTPTPTPISTPTSTPTPVPTPTPTATLTPTSYSNAYVHNQRRFRGHWHAWQLVSWRKRKLRL